LQADLLDRLLITLAVRLHAFSVCKIQRGWRLVFSPFEAITIHYVLRGSGSLRVGQGPWISFAPHSIIVVPARQSHAMGEAINVAGEAQAAYIRRSLAHIAPTQWSLNLAACGAVLNTMS
jgi:hypothetical protein